MPSENMATAWLQLPLTALRRHFCRWANMAAFGLPLPICKCSGPFALKHNGRVRRVGAHFYVCVGGEGFKKIPATCCLNAFSVSHRSGR